MTLWGGRVGRPLDPAVASSCAPTTPSCCRTTARRRLHARRLQAAGLLDDDELEEVEQRLREPRRRQNSLLLGTDEDVHSALERLLGEVGRKIHAGRSRNDQVAAAFRLYVADACVEARQGIAALVAAVLDRADADAETPMPGYTHLQRAQPVTVGHHLLAWVEMLERDLRRFAFAAEAAADSPLGAGALAGSTLPLPAPERQMRNSLDAVADRDFALDYLYAATVCFVHLSRIGEELVLWTTSEFGFAVLPEEAATGSSMMPQKLNPDVAELVRGKAGTAIGRLTGLLATVKGLPLAYDRDLQEDKPPVFAARADLRGALAALAVLDRWPRARPRAAGGCRLRSAPARDRCRGGACAGGAPFRGAHEQVAASVRDGSFTAPEPAPRSAPGPGGVRDAIAARTSRSHCDMPSPRRKHGMNRRFLPIAAVLVFAAVAAIVTLPGPATSAPESTGSITVQGTGKITSVPDRAQSRSAWRLKARRPRPRSERTPPRCGA